MNVWSLSATLNGSRLPSTVGGVAVGPGGSQPPVLDAVDAAEVTEDEVVAVVAGDRVAAAAAEEDVVAEVAVDRVADAVLRVDGREVHQQAGRLDPLRPRCRARRRLPSAVVQPVARLLHVLGHGAMVAEDDVLVVARAPAAVLGRRAGAVALDQVVAGEEGVGVRQRRSR